MKVGYDYMVTKEQVKDAINIVKEFCKERYETDEYGDMECLDCPFYEVSDGGYEYCHLTGDGERFPTDW